MSSRSDNQSLNNLEKNASKRSVREKKPNPPSDIGYIDKANRPKTNFTVELHKKCEKLLTKMKKNPNFDIFKNHNEGYDIPTFGKIEKNLKNHLYTSVGQFGSEIW